MKPKGGTKCCRRLHSLGPKCLESRKRVRLGRKRFRSQRDLEALTFTESGHFYVQEGGSSRERLGARPGAGLGAGQTAGLEASASATPSRATVVPRAPREGAVPGPRDKRLRSCGRNGTACHARVPRVCPCAAARAGAAVSVIAHTLPCCGCGLRLLLGMSEREAVGTPLQEDKAVPGPRAEPQAGYLCPLVPAPSTPPVLPEDGASSAKPQNTSHPVTPIDDLQTF